jgi:hypothetical protein
LLQALHAAANHPSWFDSFRSAFSIQSSPEGLPRRSEGSDLGQTAGLRTIGAMD